MSASAWQNDVEQIVDWASVDDKFLDRMRAKLGAEQHAVLEAVVKTRGDRAELARRLGPIVLAKLRARSVRLPERVRVPAETALKLVHVPLSTAWSPPAALPPEQIASAFLERYGAKLDELTGSATAAAAKARALAGTMKTIAGSKDLLQSVDALAGQAGELTTAASNCSHPQEDRASWLDHAKELAREAADTAQAVKAIRAQATELANRAEQLARSLEEWTEAPIEQRARTAEAMAVRVRAAGDVAASMHEQFLAAVFRR